MSTAFPPLREELRGIEPYGAPQMSYEQAPVQLNVNENPYGPSPEAAADIARAVGEAAAALNRYPDREFTELREALILWQELTQPIRLYFVGTLVCLWVWLAKGLRTRAWWAFGTMMLAWMIGLGAKYIFQRARPLVGAGPLTFSSTALGPRVDPRTDPRFSPRRGSRAPASPSRSASCRP